MLFKKKKRNLKHRGIGPGKVRSWKQQETTCTDKKTRESKEDKVMFERNVVSKKEDNVIAETEGTEPKSNRVIKSTDTFEDDEYHRSVKAIGLMRNN